MNLECHVLGELVFSAVNGSAQSTTDPRGVGTVLGSGAVYALSATAAPELCRAGEPLTFSTLRRTILRAGDTLTLPAGSSTVPALTLSASAGVLRPANPY